MRLHEQVKIQADIIAAQDEQLDQLRRYLNSAKFSVDVSVNKNDILMRLDENKRDIQTLTDQLGA